MTRWARLWLALAALVLGVEVFALSNLSPGDTLSESVIPALMADGTLWGATLVVWTGFAGWLTWHWWFQYRRKR